MSQAEFADFVAAAGAGLGGAGQASGAKLQLTLADQRAGIAALLSSMRIRNPRDFWAGAIYLALAIAPIWIGQNYQLGTSERMGPGYFPTALGSILALFGVVSLGRSFVRPGEAICGDCLAATGFGPWLDCAVWPPATARGPAHRAAVR